MTANYSEYPASIKARFGLITLNLISVINYWMQIAFMYLIINNVPIIHNTQMICACGTYIHIVHNNNN